MTDQELFSVVGILPEKTPAALPKRRRKLPLVPLAVLAVIVLGCLCAPLLTGRDPAYMDLANCAAAPSGQFWFGTDTMGRDIFACIWYGGRVSLAVGFLAAAVSTVIAVVYGAVSGMAAPWLDTAMMRLTELLGSVPSLLLVLFLQAILGTANVLSLSLVIGVTGWCAMAKVVRTEVRQLRHSGYVIACRCMGGSFHRVLWRHLAPNFVSSILFMVVMECVHRHRGGVHPQLSGHGSAAGYYLLGQHADPFPTGAEPWRVVDHRDPRRVSGGGAGVRHRHRRVAARAL